MTDPGKVGDRGAINSDIGKLPDEVKTKGSMRATSTGKGHTIKWIKDTVTGMKKQAGQLKEKVTGLFVSKKEEAAPSAKATSPKLDFLNLDKRLNTPEEIVQELKLLGQGKGDMIESCV